MKAFKEENLKECINKQFEIAGYTITFDEAKDKYPLSNKWLYDFPTTQEKEDEFKKWLRAYLKPFVFKARLDREVDWFILNYGLSIGKN